MSPLPRWSVIPPGWEETHRPTAESSMTALCDILEPNGPEPYEPDPLWQPWVTTATGVPCRVQEQRDLGNPVVGDQPTMTRRYLVVIPLDKDPGVRVGEDGHIIRVTGYKTGHDGDPRLIGRDLRAWSIMHGSLVWERDILALDNTTQGQGD